MINLLIVDDEIFTREGLVEILPLEDLGITQVRQAFDGIDALEILKTYKPDILLTDVRMPRMNGIDLAFDVRKAYPDCSIIFMSGYSDKEYLKSAIKIKAISYVEKPIEPDELESALTNAIFENSKAKTITNNIEDNIALEMTTSKDISKIEHILNSCVCEKTKTLIYKSSFLTILISSENTSVNTDVINDLKSVCKVYDLNCFISKKGDSLIVIQLFFESHSAISSINNNIFASLFASFGESLKKYFNYFITVGKIVHSLNEIYDSFTCASEIMDYKFFYDYNSVIYSYDIVQESYSVDLDFYTKFDEYLNSEDKQNICLSIKHLTMQFKHCTNTSVSYIKDVFYRLVQQIMNFSSARNISINKSLDFNTALKSVLECDNIFVLETILINLLEDMFIILKDNSKKNSPVFSILDYIHKNYSNPSLCLEDISKNTYLTPTYICVIFKDHMSKTVNKYITEYRIEKAKLFLKDSTTKMSDIAEKVGYNDPNYFSKIFRKETTYTPSEFRRSFTSEI